MQSRARLKRHPPFASTTREKNLCWEKRKYPTHRKSKRDILQKEKHIIIVLHSLKRHFSLDGCRAFCIKNLSSHDEATWRQGKGMNRKEMKRFGCEGAFAFLSCFILQVAFSSHAESSLSYDMPPRCLTRVFPCCTMMSFVH